GRARGGPEDRPGRSAQADAPRRGRRPRRRARRLQPRLGGRGARPGPRAPGRRAGASGRGRRQRPDARRARRRRGPRRAARSAARGAGLLRALRVRARRRRGHRGARPQVGRPLPGPLAGGGEGLLGRRVPLRRALRRAVSARGGERPEAGRPLIGVLGGMGPASSVDLYANVVALTRAASDRDHVRLVLDGDPVVPDRQAAVAGTGPSAGPAIVAKALRLKAAGAEVLAMACHAAHAYQADVEAATGLPFVSLVEVAVEAARAAAPAAAAAGLLATPATLTARLYEGPAAAAGLALVTPDELRDGGARLMDLVWRVTAGGLGPRGRAAAPAAAAAGLLATPPTLTARLYEGPAAAAGLALVTPDDLRDGRERLMDLVWRVKAGDLGPDVRAGMRELAAALVAAGAGVVVAACTEVPLVLGEDDVAVPLVDATAALAARLVALGAAPGG